VLAEEVLYCVDTDVVGFKWDEVKQVRQTVFNPERHTIKIVSQTERVITRTHGDAAGNSHTYRCEADGERLVCNAILGIVPWVFYRNTYTRANLFGPPAGPRTDRTIAIAYGTCTKF
jgi:hypothetical protein